nr:hypothetical protein [uncultured Flavobacterium sp.]
MLNKVRSQKSGVRSENGKVKILFSIFYFLFSLTTNAQCAMCRAALTGDANVEKAQAVNDGIVFLMVVPYLLVALIGYFVYRMKKNKTK